MLALVTAGRGGRGGGPPVFFTVPWSPMIAARGEMPGSVLRAILTLQVCIRNYGSMHLFRTASDHELVGIALAAQGYPLLAAFGLTMLRRLMRELGMMP